MRNPARNGPKITATLDDAPPAAISCLVCIGTNVSRTLTQSGPRKDRQPVPAQAGSQCPEISGNAAKTKTRPTSRQPTTSPRHALKDLKPAPSPHPAPRSAMAGFARKRSEIIGIFKFSEPIRRNNVHLYAYSQNPSVAGWKASNADSPASSPWFASCRSPTRSSSSGTSPLPTSSPSQTP